MRIAFEAEEFRMKKEFVSDIEKLKLSISEKDATIAQQKEQIQVCFFCVSICLSVFDWLSLFSGDDCNASEFSAVKAAANASRSSERGAVGWRGDL
jgi:hypothetical protein